MRKAKKLLAGILAAVVTMTGTGVSFMADNVAVVYAAESKPTLSVTSEAVYKDGAFQVDFEKSIRLTADIADNGGNPGTVDSVSYVWKVSQIVNGEKVTKTFGGKTYTHEASTYGNGEVTVELTATVVYKNNGETTAAVATPQEFKIQINQKEMKPGDAQAMVPNLGTVYIKGDSVEGDDIMTKVLANTVTGNAFGKYTFETGKLVADKPGESSITLKYTLNPTENGYKASATGWAADNSVSVTISNIKVVKTDAATYEKEPTVTWKSTEGDVVVDVGNQDPSDANELRIGLDKQQTKVYTTEEPCTWKANSDAVAILVSSDGKSATVAAIKPSKDPVKVVVTPVYGRATTEVEFDVKSYVDPSKVSFPGNMEALYSGLTAKSYIENHIKGFELDKTAITFDEDDKLAANTYKVFLKRVIDKDLEVTDDTNALVVTDGNNKYIKGSFDLKISKNPLTEIAWPALKTTDVNYGTKFTELLTDNTLKLTDGNKYIKLEWQKNMVGNYWVAVGENDEVKMDTDWRNYRVVAKLTDDYSGDFIIPTDKSYKADYAFTVRPAKISADLVANDKANDNIAEPVDEKVKEYITSNNIELVASENAFIKASTKEDGTDYKIEWYKDGQKIDNKLFNNQLKVCPTESGVYHYVISIVKSDIYKDACYDLSSWSAKSNEIEVVKTDVVASTKPTTGTYGSVENAAHLNLSTPGARKIGIVSYQTYFVAADGTKSAVQSYNVGVTAAEAVMQCVIPATTEVGEYKVYFEVKVKDGNSVYTIKTTPEKYTVEKRQLSIATKAIKVSNAIIGGKVSDAVIEYTGADKDLINQGVSFTIADDVKFDQLGTLKNVKVVAALKDTKNFSMDTKDATQEAYYVDVTVTKAPLTLAAKAVEVTEDAKVVFELENVPAGIDAAKVVYTVTDKLNRVVAANADGSYPIGEYTVTPSYTLDSAAAAVSEVKTVASKLVVKAGHKSHNPENVSQKVIPATTEKAGYTVDVCKDCDGKEIEGTKKVLCAAIDASSVATKFTTYNYTGAEVKPGIIVKSKTGRRISAANFDVTYKNNTEVGTASYTITFKGNYSGTLTGTFRIVPSGVAALKVVSGENGFTANWSESKGATGYQVVYKSKSCRTTMQMATDTTITVKDARIKAGEVVYVYVKGYKAEDGVQYTSKNWKRRGVKAL